MCCFVEIKTSRKPSRKKMSKEEAGIPKATVTKVIKESIPSDFRIAKETTDILVEGCIEFVNMIAAEANSLCSKQNKKTIAPEHVIQALEVHIYNCFVLKIIFKIYKIEFRFSTIYQ